MHTICAEKPHHNMKIVTIPEANNNLQFIKSRYAEVSTSCKI